MVRTTGGIRTHDLPFRRKAALSAELQRQQRKTKFNSETTNIRNEKCGYLQSAILLEPSSEGYIRKSYNAKAPQINLCGAFALW